MKKVSKSKKKVLQTRAHSNKFALKFIKKFQSWL